MNQPTSFISHNLNLNQWAPLISTSSLHNINVDPQSSLFPESWWLHGDQGSPCERDHMVSRMFYGSHCVKENVLFCVQVCIIVCSEHLVMEHDWYDWWGLITFGEGMWLVCVQNGELGSHWDAAFMQGSIMTPSVLLVSRCVQFIIIFINNLSKL